MTAQLLVLWYERSILGQGLYLQIWSVLLNIWFDKVTFPYNFCTQWNWYADTQNWHLEKLQVSIHKKMGLHSWHWIQLCTWCTLCSPKCEFLVRKFEAIISFVENTYLEKSTKETIAFVLMGIVKKKTKNTTWRSRLFFLRLLLQYYFKWKKGTYLQA